MRLNVTGARKIVSSACFSIVLAGAGITGCGGGGGGGSDDGGAAVEGRSYRVEATVSRDSCGERLSNVNQIFTINGEQVNTSLVTFNSTPADAGHTGGFSEVNGDCARHYEVIMEEPGEDGSIVTLRSKAECAGKTCETEWIGTMTRIDTARSLEGESDNVLKVRGETCNGAVPAQVGYRPSLFECNGNAAVLLSGHQRNNYSVVVRRDGQYNDRDPRNPSCGTNRCSPYKTQKRIELPDYQVNCLGGSGFSDDYAPVKRISIKYTAAISNANDTSQFEQYCLGDKTQALH